MPIGPHEYSFALNDIKSFIVMNGLHRNWFRYFNVLNSSLMPRQSSFCIIRDFLPIRGRILPTLCQLCSKESVGKEISEVSFVSCTTSHVGLCSFLESIEHDFIKALMIYTHN